MTRKQCEALAKKVYGPKAMTQENPRALTPERRDELRAKVKAANERKKAIEEERRPIRQRKPWDTLLAAARFALDVDGDEPSWSQLREAVELAQRDQSLADEYRELDAFCRTTNTFSYRCEVKTHRGFCYAVEVWGDTWAECAEKMQAKKAAAV